MLVTSIPSRHQASKQTHLQLAGQRLLFNFIHALQLCTCQVSADSLTWTFWGVPMVQWSIKRCPLFRLGVLSHFHKWWAFLPALHGRLCHRPGAQKQSKSPPYPLPRLEVSGCLASVMRPWSWRTWVFPTSRVGDSSEWSMGWSYSDQHKDQTCKLFTKSLWVSLVEVQNMFEVTLSLYCWRVIRFFSTHIIVLWTSPNTVIRHLPLPFKKSRWSQCLVQSVAIDVLMLPSYNVDLYTSLWVVSKQPRNSSSIRPKVARRLPVM